MNPSPLSVNMLLATFASLLLAVNAAVVKPAFLDRIVPIPGFVQNPGDKSNTRGEARLHGSSAVTDINQYPYIVAFPRVYYTSQTASGQGVVITRNYALTSAKVTYYIDYNGFYNYEMVAGVSNVAASEKSGIRYRIVDTLTHPNFTLAKHRNTIGLVKFCPDYKGTLFAQVPTFQSTLFGAGTVGSVLSWGNDLSALMYLNQTIDTDTNCLTNAAIQNTRPFDSTIDFCTVHVDTQYTCSGDEGSPFIVADTVVGVGEWGPCTYDPSTLVRGDTYTKVAQFTDWIQKTIAE